MKQTDVLYLPVYMPSVDYRPHTARTGSFSLLEWLLRRLAHRADRRQLLVLVHDEIDEQAARELAAPFGLPVLRASGSTRLEAMADLASALPGAHLSCFMPEIAFAPSSLLTRMWEHHLDAANAYTCVQGIPPYAGPEIFDGQVLGALGRIDFGGVAPDLTQAVGKLISLENENGRVRLRASPFVVDEPAAVDKLIVETALDVTRARATLEALPENYEMEALHRWSSVCPSIERPRFEIQDRTRQRLLSISAWSGYSGAEECLRLLAEGLRNSAFEQHAVVGAEGLLARRLRSAGVSVFCPNWDFHKDSTLAVEFAAAVLDESRPDIIHCNSDPGRALLVEARARRIPVVTHIRVAYPELFRNAIELSDRFIAVSEFARRRLVAHGVDPSRITTVYDGVDVSWLRSADTDRPAARAALGIPPMAFVVEMVARVAESKRHDLVLRAAKLASESVPNLHVVFVGTHGRPVLYRQILQLQRSLGLDGRVTWLPFQNDIRTAEYAADLLVLPSEEEPLGTCVLEAMAIGIPVIVSDNGGTKELVADGESGSAVAAGDADALAREIVRYARSESLRLATGNAARKRVDLLYTLEAHAAAVERVLLETIQELK